MKGRCVAMTAPHRAEVVMVDCTGAASVLSEGIALAKDVPWDDGHHTAPRYILQGSYADAVAIPYQAAFRKEMRFLVPRDTQRSDREAIPTLLAQGSLGLQDLISDVVLPEAANSAYRRLQDPDGSDVSIAFRWRP